MFIYYLFLIVLISLAILEQLLKKIPFVFAIPVIFLMVLLAGFRGEDVSRDYGNYVEMYKFVGSVSAYFTFYDFYFIYEPLFYLIVSGLKALFGSQYLPLFILFALVGVVFKAAGKRTQCGTVGTLLPGQP